MKSGEPKLRLEELFELPDDYLQPAVTARLRPALIYGMEHKNGQDRLLKVWWKAPKGDNSEIRELWQHERRQVARVLAYPGAHDVMLGLVDMIETADAFCAIHEPGYTPVSAKLKLLASTHWLKRPDVGRNRITLWRNIARIAKALGVIHAQNLIHGHLSADSVFTEGAAEPDFRLGGFEWSVGLADEASSAPAMQTVREKLHRLIYSYADDWRALGAFAACLIGLDPARLRDDDPFSAGGEPFEIAEQELELLRRLVDPAREETLEARSIARSIDLLCRDIGRQSGTRGAKLVFLARIDQQVAAAIETVTGGAVPIDDLEGQLDFVKADVAAGARLAIGADVETPDHMHLLTDRLSYLVRPFSGSEGSTWQVATLRRAEPRPTARLPSDRDIYRLPHSIELVRNQREANEQLAKLRRQAVDWSSLAVPPPNLFEDPETRTLRRAVLLVQVVEALLRAIDILPVKITLAKPVEGRTRLHVAPRRGQRDSIAKAIAEKSTSDVLDHLFEKEESGLDRLWLLTSSGALSAREEAATRVTFVEVKRDPETGGAIYEFETKDAPPDRLEVFLRQKGESGSEALIKRRLRTSAALEDQIDLVNFLIDPRRRLRDSGEVLEQDKFYDDLDKPKREALERLWTTLPGHLVVGPPGVGKTRLSAELVRRRLAVEPSSRILLSAQSHQALDHLLKTVRPQALAASEDAIVVRSRGNEEAISTDADVRRQAMRYLDSVIASPLLAEAPKPLADALGELKEAIDVAERSEQLVTGRDAAGVRALNALVLESANVVFSTTNSADVENLVEDGAQFDWVLIEESAKASGPDLIAPLALSGRRLLIGDHHQLPPFDAARLRTIISNRTALANALGDELDALGSIFFDTGLEDLRSALADEDELEDIVAMALRLIEPFRTLVEEDEAKRPMIGGRQKAVTSELLMQHRMDPAIAEVVSRCFYQGRLKTDAKRDAEAARPLAFAIQGLPPSPIVVIDMPIAGRTGQARPAESGRPRWHNAQEIGVVQHLLGRLRTKGDASKPASLAVLAPYVAQVDRLQRKLAPLEAAGKLDGFCGFAQGGRFTGTVDSAQGSEADLVIVSLVRNNHRAGRAALGFLSDPRRLNVLLSRAKQQLVIVGSLEFLREASRHTKKGAEDLGFVRTLLETIDDLVRQRAPRGGAQKAAIIPFASLSQAPRR